MLRALFTFLAALSLLLMLATLVLWVRGRGTTDYFWLIHHDGGSELIRSSEGRLSVRHTRPNRRTGPTLPRRASHWSCRVGSQLPPGPSRLHWEWRSLRYEGVPAATPAEVAAAKLASERARAALAQFHSMVRSATEPRTRAEEIVHLQRILQAQGAEQRLNLAMQLLDGSAYWEWTFPPWLALLATAPLPALRVMLWHRRRRWRREGRCSSCGYDLRFSRERCPECGRAIPAAAIPQPSAPAVSPASPA
jgi:hypothetical protein